MGFKRASSLSWSYSNHVSKEIIKRSPRKQIFFVKLIVVCYFYFKSHKKHQKTFFCGWSLKSVLTHCEPPATLFFLHILRDFLCLCVKKKMKKNFFEKELQFFFCLRRSLKLLHVLDYQKWNGRDRKNLVQHVACEGARYKNNLWQTLKIFSSCDEETNLMCVLKMFSHFNDSMQIFITTFMLHVSFEKFPRIVFFFENSSRCWFFCSGLLYCQYKQMSFVLCKRRKSTCTES